MKQKSLTITLFTLCILGLAISLTACGRDCFVGSRTAEAGSYRLDIDRMTGTDSLTMELTVGDALNIHFTVTKGSMGMKIKDPGGDTLYAGNGETVSDFTVNIPQSGVYSIILEAHHAKGTVCIQQMDGTKIRGSR